MTRPHVTQIAMCTNNMPETLRRYTEVFGFADAGGDLLWGDWLADMQEVDEVACTIWWMVGRQSLLQLELFQHTTPAQAPLPADWRASDLGWVRWGFAVPDFDASLERLCATGVETITEPAEVGGVRRVCFRDPDVGAIVEVFEEGGALPGGIRPKDFAVAPTLLYAAVSVADLEAVTRFFVDVVGLKEEAPDTLHDASAERLWGLDGARASRAVVSDGATYLEIVQYEDPVGRPPAPKRRLIDQGMMNAAVGYRERARLDELIERIEAGGGTLTTPIGPPPAGAYLRTREGISLEVLSLPQERDPDFGFAPRELKLHAPREPSF
jgi:catechol 2,3-dioxygenase-like lactoylglutathione lyase family enzyme